PPEAAGRLPGQRLAIGVAKRCRRLQGKLLDAIDETLCRHRRLDERAADSATQATRHLGANAARVKTHDRDAPPREIARQTDPRHVRRGFGHAIAVETAREVFAERADSAGDDRDLRPFVKTPEQRLSDAQRAERVDLVFAPQLRKVEPAELTELDHA